MHYAQPERMTRPYPRRAWRLVWMALALLGACAQTMGADRLTAEERLAAIRKGLVQAALDGPTHVSATQWIDANGALRESSAFRAGMKVRGVRVVGYEADAQGDPLARLQWINADAPGARSDPAGKPSCGARDTNLQHVLAWSWASDHNASADAAPLLEAVHANILTQLQQTSGMPPRWRLVERPRQDSRSSYQQAMLGSSLDTLPWQLQLQVALVSPLPSSPSSPSSASLPAATSPAASGNKSRAATEPETQPGPDPRALLVKLRLTLTARNQPRPTLQSSAELRLQATDDNWGRPSLSGAAAEQLAGQVRVWQQELQRQLACVPVVADVVQAAGAQVRINVGSAAGVRLGDEWVLAHDQHVVQRGLEPGVVNQTVLAQVQSVGPYYAELRPVAGEAKNVQTTWTAWLADALR